MSDFLSNLAARSLGTGETIQPRIPPVYEPYRRESGLRTARARSRQIEPEAGREVPHETGLVADEPPVDAERHSRPAHPPERLEVAKSGGLTAHHSAPSPAATPPAPASPAPSVSSPRAASSVLTPLAKLAPEAGHSAFQTAPEPASAAEVGSAEPFPKVQAPPKARITPEHRPAPETRTSREVEPAPQFKTPETPDVAPAPSSSNAVTHSGPPGQLPTGAFRVETRSSSPPASPELTASSPKPRNIARRVMTGPARPQEDPESARPSVQEHPPSSSERQPDGPSLRSHRGETLEPSAAPAPAVRVPVPSLAQTPAFPAKPVSRTDHSSDSPVRITIGRVDVRAVFPEQPARRTQPPRSRSTVSLDDYLKQSNGGKR